jgi:type IV pilus assembly protein PilC
MPTRVVIAASNFLARYFIFIAAGIGVLVYFLRRYYKTYRGRRVIDGMLLKTPILGMILRKIAVARFCRTLATLTSSGVPILESLDIRREPPARHRRDVITRPEKSVEGGVCWSSRCGIPGLPEHGRADDRRSGDRPVR